MSDSHTQYLVVLVGVVGSGKSTLALALTESLPNWARVNQDELGDRRACENSTRRLLEKGLSVIVDRQNFDAAQRRPWLALAVDFPNLIVCCWVLHTPPPICESRILSRTSHPTITNPAIGVSLLHKYLTLWQEPRITEGFDLLLPVSPPPNNLEALNENFFKGLMEATVRETRNRSAREQRGRLRKGSVPGDAMAGLVDRSAPIPERAPLA